MNIKDLNIEVYNQNTNELWYLINIACNNNKICLHVITNDKTIKELILTYNVHQFYRCIYNNYIWNNVCVTLYVKGIFVIKMNYKHLNNILSYLDYKFPMYLI